jgi:hypothetical protein
VPPNFNTYTINHVTAKGLQRLCLEKGSLRWHINELLGCACIFTAGHLLSIQKEESYIGYNNGILGRLTIDGRVG